MHPMKHCKWCNRIKQQCSMERNKGIFYVQNWTAENTEKSQGKIRGNNINHHGDQRPGGWHHTGETRSLITNLAPEHDLIQTRQLHPSNPAAIRALYPQCHGLWMQDKQHLKHNKVLQVHTCSSHQYSCRLTSIGPRPFSLHWSQQS